MILFDEKTVGIWFLSTITNRQDWLAGVREIEPEVKYELSYRFRYYADDGKNPFEDSDKKNWYSGQVSGTRAYVIASMRAVGAGLEARADGKLYEIINDGDFEVFHRRLIDAPFMYVRAEEKKNVLTL